MKYKHKIQIEVEVETSNPEMPLHSELAQALYQKRKDQLLLEDAKIVSTEEIQDKMQYFFREQVRFGGHKIATSITVPLPIQTKHVTPMLLHFFNEGTEKEMHRHFKRTLRTLARDNDGNRILTFKYELADFTIVVPEKYVVKPTKFSFDSKT